jgi:hypothetical protein
MFLNSNNLQDGSEQEIDFNEFDGEGDDDNN